MDKAADSIIRPAFILMTGRALGFLAAFIIPLVLVRVFDQSGFGTYKQVFLIFGTLYGVLQFGMAESLYYFLPSDSRQTGKYVVNTVLIMFTAGTVSCIILWLIRPHIAIWLNNPGLTEYILLIGIFLVLMLMSVILEIVMTVRRQNVLASATYALSDLLRSVLCIVPAIVLGELKWLLFGMIVFALCRAGATLFYLKHEFTDGFRPDPHLMRKHLAYAIPFGLAGLIEIAQANLHMYAVSYHFDAAKFAIYAVGCFQVPFIDLMMTSTANVLMVSMREKLLQHKINAVREMWYDTTRKLVLIFCLIVGGLLAIADEFIVLLFTSAYTSSVPIFMVWSLSMVFAGFLTDAVLRVYAQNRFLILLNSIKLILVVFTINWFLTRFDLVGAVLVTLMVTIIAKLIALGRVKFLIQATLAEFLPWRSLGLIFAITAIATTATLMIKTTLGFSGLPLLLTAGTVYMVLYLLLLILFGPLSKHEKRMLWGYMQIPVARLYRNRKASP